MSDDKTELVKFAKNLNWGEWVSDAVVLDHLNKIREHVNTKASKHEQDDPSGNKRVKVVVVGDGAVGKTSLLISYATGEFPTDYVPTVFENYTAKMKRPDEMILLHLWDTAGQEEYDRLRPLSYPGSDVLLLCFSTINRQSYNAIKEKWAPEVNHYVPTVPVILIGTKVDLREAGVPDPNTGKNDPISTDEGRALQKEVNAVKYMEISSKTGRGVQEVFNFAVDTVLHERSGRGVPSGTIVGSPSGGNKGNQKTAKKPGKSSNCVLM